MSPRNHRRSFAFSITIILLHYVLGTNGFTIRRPEEKHLKPPVDLVAEESSLLEVKNDLMRPNDIKAYEVKTDEALHKSVVTANAESSEERAFTDTTKTIAFSAEIDRKSGVLNNGRQFTTVDSLIGKRKQPTLSFILMPATANTNSETPTIKIRNEGSNNTPTKSTKSGYQATRNLNFRHSAILPGENKSSDITTPFIVTQSDLHTVVSKIPLLTSSRRLKHSMRALQNNIHKKNTQSPELQVTSTPLELRNNKINDSEFSLGSDNKLNDFTLSKKELKPNYDFTRSVAVYEDNNTKIPDNYSTSYNTDLLSTSSWDMTDETSKDINTVYESTWYSKETTSPEQAEFTNSKTEFSIPTSLSSTTAKILVKTELNYPRSNDISDRNQPTTVDEFSTITEHYTEMSGSEVSQTRYLNEEFKSSTLTSTQTDRLDVKSPLLHNQVTSSPTQQPAKSEPIFKVSLSSSKMPQQRFGMVSSMRAGFLDYSGKTSTTHETTAQEDSKHTFANLFESIDLGENDSSEYNNKTTKESQSELAEDAIKEELLKEELLSDQIASSKLNHDDGADGQELKTFDVDTSGKDNISTVDKHKLSPQPNKDGANEDTLSVKPISLEQGKNMDLYVVSPNYKPMKRIEVQPAKPFVRDPDDNSWRNVSISSLGIVFKPKNSSKSFTQVLKNKTETVLNSFTDKNNKTGLPDLRERLEKMAEVRKSKKKRVNMNGDTIYSDYEESNISGENITTVKVETTLVTTTESVTSTETSEIPTTRSPLTTSDITSETTQSNTAEDETTITTKENAHKIEEHDTLTTVKPNKVYNLAEYYDTTDEYDADYLTLSKFDIKKFTSPVKTTQPMITTSPPSLTKPLQIHLPDRRPTVEYFPPRVTPKVNIHDYDTDFQRKINLYSTKDDTKFEAPTVGTFYVSPPTASTYKGKEELSKRKRPIEFPLNRQQLMQLNKNLYLTETQVSTPQNGFDINDGNFNRGSFVIKHYRDFLDVAAKDDDDRNADYVTLTEPPLRGITLDELEKSRANSVKPAVDHDFDYDVQYRKDVLDRFVNNFNQNSEKYKVDFPIMYNNSIIHQKYEDNGKVLASSNAFMKRLYGNTGIKEKFGKPCDPNCENLTVDLSPDYELHYYVPEQEEKEVAEVRPGAVPFRYRL